MPSWHAIHLGYELFVNYLYLPINIDQLEVPARYEKLISPVVPNQKGDSRTTKRTVSFCTGAGYTRICGSQGYVGRRIVYAFAEELEQIGKRVRGVSNNL